MKKGYFLFFTFIFFVGLINSQAQTPKASIKPASKQQNDQGTKIEPGSKSNANIKPAAKATVQDARKEMPAKNTNNKTSSELPQDFPKYKNTGNSEKDQADFNQAKIDWYNAHPDYLKKQNDKNNSEVQYVSKARFNSLSEEQKKLILDNPNRYKIVE